MNLFFFSLLTYFTIQQLAKPITYGANVGYLPYEEAEEITGTPTTLSGWGGTLVSRSLKNVIINN